MASPALIRLRDGRFGAAAARMLRRLPLLRRARRLLRDARGYVAVEFGLTALPFFFLICLVVESAMLMWAEQVFDLAVQGASRFVVTGEAQTNNWTRDQFRQKICDQAGAFFKCAGVTVEVSVYDNFSFSSTSRPTDAKGNFDPTAVPFVLACPDKITLVRAFYKWPTITGYLWGSLKLTYADQGDGTRLMVAANAFRTEPFPKPSSGC